ncbi:hypothetical protein LO772_32430 [Yinghuangia sp. ASG 101]|uniref:hypothetical protein n=1 Tax=Yinghuangia sp. ASG 101 TaxID=2896848 RepID=UPI001E285C0B|nr:hypothetical protein [Yinghuangia sp. ASG 101]UGQ11445.1 hypothetical protein LO772_32430 [Yinghuangia sp. ASG 101]
MTGTSSGTTELKATYAAQVSADLERNAEQQQRLTVEIESLQGQLTALRRDHALLRSMITALRAPVPPKSAKQGPARRRSTATARPSRTSTTGATRPAAKKATAKPTRRTKSATGPTLVELIRRYLTAQDAPRSAADVTDALTRAHPGRSIKPKVVRVTIEGLVSRGQVQRHKRNRSVSYTARKRNTGNRPATA